MASNTFAKPDTFYLYAGDTLTVAALDGLLANDYDTDPGLPAVIATSFSSPSHGSLSVSLDGSLTYVPVAGFVGADTFTYYISDGVSTASAVATIDVVQPTLIAAPDTFVTKANGVLTVDAAHGLLANDLSSGGTLVASSFSAPSHGTLNVSLDGSLTYTPVAGFVGADTFSYYISNGYGTAWTTATIDVVDAKPIANTDVYSVHAGQTLTVSAINGLLANDVDPGGTITATSFSTASHGSLSVSLDGSLTYVPDAGFVGADTFTYYISDGARPLLPSRPLMSWDRRPWPPMIIITSRKTARLRWAPRPDCLPMISTPIIIQSSRRAFRSRLTVRSASRSMAASPIHPLRTMSARTASPITLAMARSQLPRLPPSTSSPAFAREP